MEGDALKPVAYKDRQGSPGEDQVIFQKEA
jgi:hypothetical protein